MMKGAAGVAKHYVYRMDYDTGFAPNTKYGICSLSGCKKNSIERWAEQGSWVIGIGGNNTGKSDKLIFAMEVEKNLPYAEFKKTYPAKSGYLHSKKAGSNVLISRNFYYFGNKATDLPRNLAHLVIKGQGCKRVDEEDIDIIQGYLSKRYKAGVLGEPNNRREKDGVRGKC